MRATKNNINHIPTIAAKVASDLAKAADLSLALLDSRETKRYGVYSDLAMPCGHGRILAITHVHPRKRLSFPFPIDITELIIGERPGQPKKKEPRAAMHLLGRPELPSLHIRLYNEQVVEILGCNNLSRLLATLEKASPVKKLTKLARR
jgi:hypothetical protein